ncbi:MAG: flagellar biosynthesis protein FlhB [Bdellovibrionales bacterium]
MADDSGEKTEEATPQRREEYRKKGQVAQTKELASALVLVGACLSIWLMSGFFLEQCTELIQMIVKDYISSNVRLEDNRSAVIFAAKKSFFLLAPVLVISFILSGASSLMQVGLLYNEEALKPDLKKIDPIQGLKRLFSLRSLMEGIKAVAKVTVVGFIIALIVKDELVRVPALVEYSVEQLFLLFGDITIRLIGAVGLFMLMLSALDFAYQKYEMEKQMRMSKQEIKEETKNREGDPQIKAKIRRIQMEMSNNRMMAEVPKADVIVTNPTHLAVAIKYEQGWMAPMIVAMGADAVAMKIREVAEENKVPIVENKPLARTMYKTLKIGAVIPRDLFQSVAEVLAYVYRLKKKVMN